MKLEFRTKNTAYGNSLSTERKYCLLDRMRIDCEYFLGFGARHEKYLWAGSVKAQIESMLYLYDSIKQKPEWLTREQILNYKKLMEG